MVSAPSSTALRVAIVDPATWSVAYDLPLAESLARAGCDVTLHCARSPHVGLPASALAGVRVRESFYRHRFPGAPRRLSRAASHPLDLAKLTRVLAREADIVLVQWMPARAFDAKAWGKLAQRVPVVFTAHNAQERDGAVDPGLLRGFSAVVAHSDGGAATLREAGLPVVWRLAIGAYDQYATMPDPDELPVDVAAGTPLAVFAGLLREYKGVDVLLAAWPSVRERVPDARLVVAGRPVDDVLPAEQPAGATFLPRFLDEAELGWLLRRADVCCLPYRQIDMSGIAASALACGTPLVVTDVGGLGEYAGRGALVVPPEDPRALADAMVRILGSPEERDRLSGEARAAVATHYSWDAIAQRYLERFAALLRGASSSR